MATIKRIGLITSGGDCGGLNAVIKGVAQAARQKDVKTFVIPRGYAGLYNLKDFPSLVELTAMRTHAVQTNLAGSEAGHSRVKIKKIKDPRKYQRIKEGLQKHGIDGLIISGGDDTGSVIVDLDKQGISCIHTPKTMDLDLQTYSVGGDSSINRIAQFVSDLKTTGITHNRIMVVEVFGRYTGHTAFRGGIGGGAACILIPEIPADFDIVYQDAITKYMERIRASDISAGTYTIVVAEGITDAKGNHMTDDSAGIDSFGHKKLSGAGKYVVKQMEDRLKKDPSVIEFMKELRLYVKGVYEIPEIRNVTIGHLARSGESSAYDINFGMQIGAAAVHLLLNGMKGVTVVDVRGKEIIYTSTEQAIKQNRVNLDQVALFEQMGICFGRKPRPYKPEYIQRKGKPIRYL